MAGHVTEPDHLNSYQFTAQFRSRWSNSSTDRVIALVSANQESEKKLDYVMTLVYFVFGNVNSFLDELVNVVKD